MDSGVRFYRMRLAGKKPNRQEDVADATGISRPRLSQIETGRVVPSVEEVETLAKYFEVTVGHLYSPDQLDWIAAHEKERAFQYRGAR